MQNDVLTLSVDTANDGNPSDQIFSRYEEHLNRATYIGVDHTPGSRNQIGIYRTFPTRNGNFKGVGKSSLKVTQDIEVAGVDSETSVSAPIICEVSFSVPVGSAAATVTELRQRVLALLDDDSFMDALNIQLMV